MMAQASVTTVVSASSDWKYCGGLKAAMVLCSGKTTKSQRPSRNFATVVGRRNSAAVRRDLVHQHVARPAPIRLADDPLARHAVDHARGAVVSDAKLALDHRDRGLLGLDYNAHRVIIIFVFLPIVLEAFALIVVIGAGEDRLVVIRAA